MRNSSFSLIFFILSILSVVIIAGCASEVSPDGGPPDNEPPQLKKSTPENYSVNFDTDKIVLEFNKYVIIEGVAQELVVSPPLDAVPEVNSYSRRIELILDEDLQDSTTYTFNFGESIKSFREQVPHSEFKYVVSTGPVIDSGYVDGKVEESFTNEPAENVKVLLYRNLEDSAVFNERPLYFARTDENGRYRLENIAPGDYRLYALEDVAGDFNYGLGDKFGFYPEIITLEDSLQNKNMRIFKEQLSKMRLLDHRIEHRGKHSLIFNHESEKLRIESITSGGKKPTVYRQWEEDDTLRLWYYPYHTDTNAFVLYEDTVPFDTVAFKYDQDTLPEDSFFTLTYEDGNQIPVNKPFRFKSPDPLNVSHKDKVHILKDSQEVIEPEISFYPETSHTSAHFDFRRQYDRNYVVYIEEGAFCNIFNQCNDSLYKELRTPRREDFGEIRTEVTLNTEHQGLVQLVSEDGEEVIMQKTINESRNVWFRNIPPGHYRIKGIEDRDGNEEWSTGNFLLGRQPERVFFNNETIHLRANWEIRDNPLVIGD